jgi:hypothetical protein
LAGTGGKGQKAKRRKGGKKQRPVSLMAFSPGVVEEDGYKLFQNLKYYKKVILSKAKNLVFLNT